MIEIVGFAIVFIILFILAARAFGAAPQSGRVKTTSPKEKSVDGFGGARGYDYSYSGWSHKGGNRPFPVGLKREREKTDTYRRKEPRRK